MQVLDTLYKADNRGEIRVWWVEIDGDKIRNVSGLQNGEKVASGWKLMKAKNTGKMNATTPEQQAVAEANSLYEKQLGKGGYHRNIEDAHTKKYVEPMLAKSYEDIFPLDVDEYGNFTKLIFSQPKLDGHRCIATKDMLQTRNGKRYVSVPHIELTLMKLFKKYPDIILDGELYNHDLKDNFNEISSCVRKTKPTKEDLEQSSVIEYHVYDIIDENMNCYDRNLRLYSILEEFKGEYGFDKIKFVETVPIAKPETLDEFYSKYVEDGYEGQMIRFNEPYEIGKRSKFLVKRKEFITEEYTLVDILEGEGNWAGSAKTLRYQLDDERIASAGIRGTKEWTEQLLKDKNKWIGGQITLRYFQKTPDGIPRFPVAIEFFEGKRDI